MGGYSTFTMHTIVFLKDADSRLCHAEEKHAWLRLQAVCVHYFNCLFFIFFFLLLHCTFNICTIGKCGSVFTFA